jgi:hypothetical protein
MLCHCIEATSRLQPHQPIAQSGLSIATPHAIDGLAGQQRHVTWCNRLALCDGSPSIPRSCFRWHWPPSSRRPPGITIWLGLHAHVGEEDLVELGRRSC